MKGIHPKGTTIPRADAGLDAGPAPIQLPGPDAPRVAAVAVAAAAVAAASAKRRDDLMRISGIDREVERLLNVQGYCTYLSIAYMTDAEMQRLGRILGDSERIGRENWIDQAKILAQTSGQTAYSRAYDRERYREAGNSGCGHDAGL